MCRYDRIVPPSAEDLKKPQYNILDEDGIAAVGMPISTGDIYVNKQTPVNTTETLTPAEGEGT